VVTSSHSALLSLSQKTASFILIGITGKIQAFTILIVHSGEGAEISSIQKADSMQNLHQKL